MMQSLIAGLCGLFAVSASAFQFAPATAQSNEPLQVCRYPMLLDAASWQSGRVRWPRFKPKPTP